MTSIKILFIFWFCILPFLTSIPCRVMGRVAEAYPATYGEKWAFAQGYLDGALKVSWDVPPQPEHVLSAPGLEPRTLRCSAQSPLSFYFVSFYVIVIFLELHSTAQQRLLELKDSSLVFSMNDHAVLSVPGRHEWWKTKKRGGGRENVGRAIMLLFNPLKVETHHSDTTCTNDSCSVFIKL